MQGMAVFSNPLQPAMPPPTFGSIEAATIKTTIPPYILLSAYTNFTESTY